MTEEALNDLIQNDPEKAKEYLTSLGDNYSAQKILEALNRGEKPNSLLVYDIAQNAEAQQKDANILGDVASNIINMNIPQVEANNMSSGLEQQAKVYDETQAYHQGRAQEYDQKSKRSVWNQAQEEAAAKSAGKFDQTIRQASGAAGAGASVLAAMNTETPEIQQWVQNQDQWRKDSIQQQDDAFNAQKWAIGKRTDAAEDVRNDNDERLRNAQAGALAMGGTVTQTGNKQQQPPAGTGTQDIEELAPENVAAEEPTSTEAEEQTVDVKEPEQPYIGNETPSEDDDSDEEDPAVEANKPYVGNEPPVAPIVNVEGSPFNVGAKREDEPMKDTSAPGASASGEQQPVKKGLVTLVSRTGNMTQKVEWNIAEDQFKSGKWYVPISGKFSGAPSKAFANARLQDGTGEKMKGRVNEDGVAPKGSGNASASKQEGTPAQSQQQEGTPAQSQQQEGTPAQSQQQEGTPAQASENGLQIGNSQAGKPMTDTMKSDAQEQIDSEKTVAMFNPGGRMEWPLAGVPPADKFPKSPTGSWEYRERAPTPRDKWLPFTKGKSNLIGSLYEFRPAQSDSISQSPELQTKQAPKIASSGTRVDPASVTGTGSEAAAQIMKGSVG